MKILRLASSSAVLLGGINSASLRNEGDLSIPRQLTAMEQLASMTGTNPGTCTLENGFDYVGHDLWSYPTPDASPCCNLCKTNPGCVAFTFDARNGGSCTFKSARDNIVLDQNKKSAVLVREFEPYQCKASDVGIDYVGNDIGSEKAATPAECCGKCRAKTGCRAFSHTNYEGGTCWLKSKKGATQSNGSVTSGEAYPPDPTPRLPIPEGATILQNTDYVGYDLQVTSTTLKAATPELCYNMCMTFSIAGCRHISWSNYNGGSCWMKYRKGPVISSNGVSSATVYQDPNPVPCDMDSAGIDFVGNDIGSAASPNADGCCSICWDTNNCHAFTWSNYNGGTCWLKDKRSGTTITPGVQSAVVGKVQYP